jgi:hypothetical protein
LMRSNSESMAGIVQGVANAATAHNPAKAHGKNT